MNPRQLKAFIAVAQTLSFARAGRRLHLSQPALSLAIRGLEQELGGKLFSRTTRQVRLTQEGAALLPQAMQLLADWDRVRDRLQQRFSLRTGHLTIAAMPSFAANALPRVLQEFRRNHPDLGLSVRDVVHEEVLDLVSSGRVEIGFTFEPESAPDLAFESLFVDRFVAIVPPDAALASRRTAKWEALEGLGIITLERPSSMRRLIEAKVAEAGLAFKIDLECSQLTTVSQLVAAGLGASVIPSLAQDQARALGARVLPLAHPVIR
ncbi:MAG: hypothetical protein RLZZ200_2797, partial [Pseudomonadota bacterium]